MNTLKRIFSALFPPKLSKEEAEDIEFCRKMIMAEIKKVTARSYKVKDKLGPEIITSLIYLKIFASWLSVKTFRNIEEAWQYMNDIKGIIEKVFYISNYVYMIEESMKAAAGKTPASPKTEKKQLVPADYLSENGK